MLPVLGKKAVLEWCMEEGLIGSSYVCPKCGKSMGKKRTDSSHVFSDLVSGGDGDLSILRSSRKTYSKVKESCDSGNEKYFCKSTTNTKNIASSSLSCENDFIDKNIHSELIKTHENKIINEDPLISRFDNEEDECSASRCDFIDELFSTFPYKT
ncbi:hypothetical protein TNCV_2425521 [Trichonephila clavipes]|nr:hypothetical protein TNCV_2425521 [Trichonephila clavipes]